MSEHPESVLTPEDRRAFGFLIAGGLLLLLAVLLTQPASAPAQGGWLGAVTQNLSQRGYDWLKIDLADGVATVSGEAPDVDSRQYGFEAAEKAIEAADAGREVRLVVDATHMEGGPASVGAALPALGPAPEIAACQSAFGATLEGRTINFAQGSASLTDDNKRLLDALSAVAIRCKAYRIEIGGHTDRKGGAEANRMLSEARANAVLRYLTDKGAPPEGLTAHGYGASHPLDRGRSAAADARNRRIEFTVTAS